jgi:hypothetical protein
MSTCRWTGRPRSEWSASNRPIAPTIGPPAHHLCPRYRKPGTPATRVPAAFCRSNCETEPTCARAERNTRTASNDADIRPSLVRLGFKTRHKGGHFALFPGDCRNRQTRWRREADLNSRDPSAFGQCVCGTKTSPVSTQARPAVRYRNCGTTKRDSDVDENKYRGLPLSGF